MTMCWLRVPSNATREVVGTCILHISDRYIDLNPNTKVSCQWAGWRSLWLGKRSSGGSRCRTLTPDLARGGGNDQKYRFSRLSAIDRDVTVSGPCHWLHVPVPVVPGRTSSTPRR